MKRWTLWPRKRASTPAGTTWASTTNTPRSHERPKRVRWQRTRPLERTEPRMEEGPMGATTEPAGRRVIRMLARGLYGLLAAVLLVAGAAVLLLGTGLLPAGVRQLILDLGRND